VKLGDASDMLVPVEERQSTRFGVIARQPRSLLDGGPAEARQR
jgi:hypothetical protein